MPLQLLHARRLLDDPGFACVWKRDGCSLKPHAQFEARVAAEHRPILDQCRLCTEPGRCDRRRTSRRPTADDHNIKVAARLNVQREPGQPRPLTLDPRDIFRRNVAAVPRKNQRVAPSETPRKVVQRDAILSRTQIDGAAIDPGPRVVSRLAECHRQRFAVHNNLEPAGMVFRQPISRTHPHAECACLGNPHYGGRICDTRPDARCDKICRADEMDKLRVRHPAAIVPEILRIQPYQAINYHRLTRRRDQGGLPGPVPLFERCLSYAN